MPSFSSKKASKSSTARPSKSKPIAKKEKSESKPVLSGLESKHDDS